MIRYKLTTQVLTTHNGFQWTPKKWVNTNGEGDLAERAARARSAASVAERESLDLKK